MQFKIVVRQPEYIKRFKCAQNLCEENCCSRWSVGIDKEAYNRFEQIEDKKLKRKIMRSIAINQAVVDNDVDYAFIRFSMGNVCPFLNKNSRCFIHEHLGEEYLGSVCNLYPRFMNIIDNVYERSLDCSCIEAAKIVLLNKDKITFEESSEIISGTVFIGKEIDTEICSIGYENKAFLKEMRKKSIDIIQNRNETISSRLYVLGKFLEETRINICSDYDHTNDFINSYDINCHGSEFVRNEKNYEKQYKFYSEMILKVEGLSLLGYCSSRYFKKNMIKALKVFKNKYSELIKAYMECEREVFEKYDYIFENYLVNEMFKSLFPFSYNNIMYNDYLMLLFKYGFIKFFITGQYLFKGSTSEKDILWSIQSFEKKIGHDLEYLKEIRTYLISNEMDNPEFAITLL